MLLFTKISLRWSLPWPLSTLGILCRLCLEDKLWSAMFSHLSMLTETVWQTGVIWSRVRHSPPASCLSTLIPGFQGEGVLLLLHLLFLILLRSLSYLSHTFFSVVAVAHSHVHVNKSKYISGKCISDKKKSAS